MYINLHSYVIAETLKDFPGINYLSEILLAFYLAFWLSVISLDYFMYMCIIICMHVYFMYIFMY